MAGSTFTFIAPRAVVFLLTPVTRLRESKVLVKGFCCFNPLEIASIISCFGTGLYGLCRSFATGIKFFAYMKSVDSKQRRRNLQSCSLGCRVFRDLHILRPIRSTFPPFARVSSLSVASYISFLLLLPPWLITK